MAKALYDNEYFFEVIVFQVEDTLFRVPKQNLNVPGTPFEMMFSLPQPEDSEPEGTTETRPIILPVSKQAFKAFLRLLYPFTGTAVTAYDDWMGVLDLSSMWEFADIKQKAIVALTPLLEVSRRDVEQILLGKKYNIHDWVKSGFKRLVAQEEPPPLSNLLNAGLDPLTIAKVYSARERVYKKVLSRVAASDAKASHCRFCGTNWTQLTENRRRSHRHTIPACCDNKEEPTTASSYSIAFEKLESQLDNLFADSIV